MRKNDEMQDRFDAEKDSQDELDLNELMNVEGGEDSEPEKNCGLGCFIGGMTETEPQKTMPDGQA
jgi:hypothetical protein